MRFLARNALAVAFAAALPAVPAQAQPGPSGGITTTGAVVTSGDEITFTWEAVTGSTFYQLWVEDSTGAAKHVSWYTAAGARCGGGEKTCAVTLSIDGSNLELGAGRWWVQTWNASGTGPWSKPHAFRLATNSDSVAIGRFALDDVTTGFSNVALGARALGSNTTGPFNTAVGLAALESNTTGEMNTALGLSALDNLASGDENIAVGVSAGTNLVMGTDNIYIGTSGGSGTESQTIRIGNVHTAAYIQGIYSRLASSGVAVFVNGLGKLGTTTSSRRFKEHIRDMGAASDALMRLRPVSFYYKPDYDPGPRRIEYGLVAEEVADVLPELVVWDADGRPETVRYHLLVPMLLNELQEQHRRIAVLEQELEALTAGFEPPIAAERKASAVR